MTEYICGKCGEATSKWQGKCPACSAWGSIEECAGLIASPSKSVELETLSDIKPERTKMISSLQEFDEVCGGGLVPKSVILLGGEPGIGKSTLLLQICNAFDSTKPIIYIAGEESAEQIRLRGDRLQVNLKKIACASVICAETIVSTLEKHDPGLVILDSIQTLFSTSVESAPGTVTQMRTCSHLLIQWAKNSSAVLIIVGHVTKDGVLAGPKVIEHMVDVVLHFEGDRGGHPIRILRTTKNRFGSTDVIGAFEINANGLVPVRNLSEAFIKQRSQQTAGSTIFPSMDGNRAIFLEIQALIANSYMQSPKRSVVGWDISRLHMILAILETKCGIHLANKEVYLNVVGGAKVTEPAGDLAAVLAIISAYHKIPVATSVAAFGEVSLSGEIRTVSKMDMRIQEALKLGFDQLLVPKGVKMDFGIQFSRINELVFWLQNGKVKDGHRL